MVDTRDLKSLGFVHRCSSPLPRTNGRLAERYCIGLENRSLGKTSGGSNPSSSAIHTLMYQGGDGDSKSLWECSIHSGYAKQTERSPNGMAMDC